MESSELEAESEKGLSFPLTSSQFTIKNNSPVTFALYMNGSHVETFTANVFHHSCCLLSKIKVL